ncbi:MAG: hypothetical protein NT018_02145 [Armatimonadetes bacterium]|nr:hypothetical protein [Armatimonadota bacterium]
MASKSKVMDPWVSSPDLIRAFTEMRPRYEKLCSEVQYILEKRIKEAGIQISSVTCRAKTLVSFLGKVDRKPYVDPLEEITDFAGARVVCLYLDDIPAIEEIIQTEFDLVDRLDKLAEKKPNEFGYGALHFIVRLGKKSSGARYDDLKDFICEIQVRTVLQDAWAIIDHHLAYKNESAIPSTIQRQLNGLAGALETADHQFRNIHLEHRNYVDKVHRSTEHRGQLLATELNLDSFREYLKWRFRDRPTETISGQLSFYLELLQSAGYSTLADLEGKLDDDVITRAAPIAYQATMDSACSFLTVALTLVDQGLKERLSLFLPPYEWWP